MELKEPHHHVELIGIIANLTINCYLGCFQQEFRKLHIIIAIAGTPINIIAKLLGHANLNTINRYVLLPKSKINEMTKMVA